MSKKVKMALIGLGNMGLSHIKQLNELENVEIVGVCDIVKEKADSNAKTYNTKAYYDYKSLIDNSGLEAILIAVPHFDHIEISKYCFEKNIHVLCEKPITVTVVGAKDMLDSYSKAKAKNEKLVFGLMFQDRTAPHYKQIKSILDEGILGKLTRVTWINTAWFRSQSYYDSGGWRATWAGEGGGVLTNQCPHNMDTYNWFFGLPSTVNGFAHIGKYHNIEVEDEVTAYMEHDNGMIGHFITTTGECPGTNRLEIVGENGTLLYENKNLTLFKNRMSMLKYSNETKSGFDKVENWNTQIPVDYTIEQAHIVVTKKFIETILTGENHLVADAYEGLNPVMLANAIMQSSFLKSQVSLPMDGTVYEGILNDLKKNSKFVKAPVKDSDSDFSKSFSS